MLVWITLVDLVEVVSFTLFEAGVLLVIVDDIGLLLLEEFLSFLILSNPDELGVCEALAEIELLVACPAEVLGTDVAIVRLCALSIHRVCRVTLRTAHALAKSQC